MDKGKGYDYDFNYKKEWAIYKKASMKRISKNELKLISDNADIKTYSQWKERIVNKYSKCSKEYLINFSHYLKSKLRKEVVDLDFYKVFFTVIATFIVNTFINKVFELNDVLYLDEIIPKLGLLEPKYSVCIGGVMLLALIFLLGILISFLLGGIWSIVDRLWLSHNNQNMYNDYIEIIEYILEKRLEGK